jgi:hypothetical protein
MKLLERRDFLIPRNSRADGRQTLVTILSRLHLYFPISPHIIRYLITNIHCYNTSQRYNSIFSHSATYYEESHFTVYTV